MKLKDLHHNSHTMYAWLVPATNPNGEEGFALKYIQPAEAWFNSLIKNIQHDPDKKDRLAELESQRQKFRDKKIKYFANQIGWWSSANAFHSDEVGMYGNTKGIIRHKFPNMVITKDEKTAMELSQKSKQI